MIDDDRIRAARERRLAQAEAEGETARAERLRKQLGITDTPDDDASDDDENLAKLRKAELVERAEAAGVETDGLTKAELLAALEED